ncbi:hypothetical protein [Crateriforma conspicua]|nr:hypothetical protein [Crateriforma conspicua]
MTMIARGSQDLARTQQLVALAFSITVILCLIGCSGTTVETRRSSTAAFSEGMAAFELEEYAKAEPLLAEAMSGALQPDVYVEAGVARAKCLGHLNMVQEGLGVADIMREGLPSEGEYFALRAAVYAAAGEVATAREEFAKARRLDRQVQPPPGI